MIGLEVLLLIVKYCDIVYMFLLMFLCCCSLFLNINFMIFLLSLKLYNYKFVSLKIVDVIFFFVYFKEFEKLMFWKKYFLDNIMCNVLICCIYYYKVFINIIVEI